MADHKDPKDKQEYSVDDILAEYGSGKYGSSKVVEFPGPAERQGVREAQRRTTPGGRPVRNPRQRPRWMSRTGMRRRWTAALWRLSRPVPSARWLPGSTR